MLIRGDAALQPEGEGREVDLGSPSPCVFLSELMKSGQVLEKGEFLFFLAAADKRTISSLFFFPSTLPKLPLAAVAGLVAALSPSRAPPKS